MRVVVVVVLVAIEVVVLPPWDLGGLCELTAGEEAAEGLPELVRHGVVQDRVDGAESKRRESSVQSNPLNGSTDKGSI